jgi:hypothetical protein
MDTYKRHDGKLHDSVTCSNTVGEEYTTTVIGPEGSEDLCYVLLHDAALSFSFHLTSEQAVKLGKLLIAAGRDKAAKLPADTSDDTPEHVWTCPRHGAQHAPACMACGSEQSEVR